MQSLKEKISLFTCLSSAVFVTLLAKENSVSLKHMSGKWRPANLLVFTRYRAIHNLASQEIQTVQLSTNRKSEKRGLNTLGVITQ